MRSTVLFGALAVGLVLTQQACTPAPETRQDGGPAPSTTSAAPPKSSQGKANAGKAGSGTTDSGKAETTATGAATNKILSGKRQVVIRPVQSFESILAVDSHGRLNLTDGEAEHSLFVLTPANGKYLIKTAKADAGGEPSCMGVKTNGSGALTVEAAACDTGRAGQLFTITAQKAKDGHPTYAISNRDAFLQISTRGDLIAEELGDAPLKTTFSFADNGPSTLPILD